MNKLLEGVSVEVLDTNHGAKVVEAFKKLGVDTRKYLGICNKEGGFAYRFYGVVGGFFGNRSLIKAGKIITLEQLESMIQKPEQKSNQTIKNMKVSITKELTFGEEKRVITVVSMIEDGRFKTGYSVKLPEDKQQEKLAVTIAEGRARKEKTNLTPDMHVGKGMDKKFILYAIAENTMKVIADGNTIKGIKPIKKSETKAD